MAENKCFHHLNSHGITFKALLTLVEIEVRMKQVIIFTVHLDYEIVNRSKRDSAIKRLEIMRQNMN